MTSHDSGRCYAICSTTLLACVAAVAVAAAQTPAPQFDVVSIKRSASTGPTNLSQRPGGGVTVVGGNVRLLLAMAFPHGTDRMIGLPPWTASEYYDVSATAAVPNVTQDDRRRMLQAMLADRLKLVTHTEMREQQAYDLVLARQDRRLPPSVRRVETDCDAIVAERARARDSGQPTPLPSFTGPMPPCTYRVTGYVLDGDMTMATLAAQLRQAVGGAQVTDKTGLAGYYAVKIEYSPIGATGAIAAPADLPTIFTALPEQLGLKLESTRAQVEFLVIDRIERPTEN